MQDAAYQGQSTFWGPLATVVWGMLIAALFSITQIICIGIYLGVTGGMLSPEGFSEALLQAQNDGLVLSLCTFATTLVCGLLTVAVVRLKRGSDLKEYLGLTLPATQQIIRWLLFFGAVILLLDLVTLLLGKPIVPEYMAKVYSSLESRWVLWIALVFAAPLFEELFFRGFLIKGLAASWLGPAGAVVLSSAVWAIVHMQYDSYGIATIFIMGLILGAARVKAGSTMLAILLHSFANFVAMTETAILAATQVSL